MRRTSLFLLGLLLLCCIGLVFSCGRGRRQRSPPPPNRPPEFHPDCYKNIQWPANIGKTGAYVTWPPDKARAADPDSSSAPSVTLVTSKDSGSYFPGAYASTVIYKARDSRNGVAYCDFRVFVEVKYCSHVPELKYGQRRCTGQENNVYGSRCRTICETGYVITGFKEVECQQNKQWTASFATCEPKSCGSPGTVENGHVICNSGHAYNQLCNIQCKEGYQYENYGPYIRCRHDGSWDPLYPCHDNKPPTFPDGCPAHQMLKSGPLGSQVAVSWTDPAALDNSGQTPTLTSSPAKNTKLNPGNYLFTVTATDAEGNSASCVFLVSIEVSACRAIQTPYNGKVACTGEYMVGSECSVTCNRGYQVQGSDVLICTITEDWDHSEPTCEAVECSELQMDYGTFICQFGRTYKQGCYLDCDPGFRVDGPGYTSCSADGSWTAHGVCRDEEPPSFPAGCPDNIETFAAALGQPTLVTWNSPDVTDNSGAAVQLNSDHQPGSEFPIGVTLVTYSAIDESGHVQKCTFRITVTTLTCPVPDLEEGEAQKLMIYDCPDGYVHGATCTLNCTYGYPLQGSNSITCARDDQTYPPTMFWEWPGPNSVPPNCQWSACPDLTPPDNGALACYLGNAGWDCLMSCQDPYDIPANLAKEHFFCPNSLGKWIPSTVPDCTVRRRPRQARLMGDLFYYTNSCNVSQAELRQRFITRMNTHDILKDACINVPSCTVENVQVHCGASRTKKDVSSHEERLDTSGKHNIFRRQAGTSSHYVLISFEVPINFSTNSSLSPEETFQLVDEIKQTLLARITSGVENGTFNEDGMFLDPDEAVGDPEIISVDCPEGNLDKLTSNRLLCVGCSKGNYLPDKQACQECPVGTYSDIDNATSCTPCPEGWSTAANASQDISQCKELCTLGSMSPSGFVPCQPCPAGQYQSSSGAKSCEPCPVNTWTENAGANSSEMCIPADIMLSDRNISGAISKNWSSLTVSLRVGVAVRNSSVTISIKSSVDGSTLASHVFSPPSQMEEIGESESGYFYHVAFMVASSNKTQPAQTFTVLTLDQPPPDSTTLTVLSAQRGVLVSSMAVFGRILTTAEMTSLATSCAVDVSDNLLVWTPSPESVSVPTVCDAVNECSSSPCGSHGMCRNQLGSFKCQCQVGWSGVTCSVSEPCVQQQCQNGATCVPAADNYTCVCPSGFSGFYCDKEIVDGGWTDWSSWTSCTLACGAEQQQRLQLCTNPLPQHGGSNCSGNGTEVRECTNPECSSDEVGSWSNWNAWSNCSVSCSGGVTTRQRTCENINGTGQAVCEGKPSDLQACNTHPCPVHGGWGSWSAWSLCSVTCGEGIQTRERSCDSPVPAYSGDPCGAADSDSQACKEGKCPACKTLSRTAGSIWICEELSLSPYFKRCSLQCNAAYAMVSSSVQYTCGENTSYLWDYQPDGENDIATPQGCSRTHTLKYATYTLRISLNTDCDESSPTMVENGIQENIDKNVPCRQGNVCKVKVSGNCLSSRKRSTPVHQVLLTSTLDVNVTESELENNDTAWTEYQDQMNLVNQSLSLDDDTFESLFTVTLPGGQTVTPDMSSVVTDFNITCPAGSVVQEEVFACVDCPPGTKEENGECVQCPLAYYQDETGATDCKACPPGLSWDLPGAVSVAQCFFKVDVPGTSTTQAPGTKDDKKNTHLLIGLVAGLVVVVVIVLIVLVIVCCKHWNKQWRNPDDSRRVNRLSLYSLFPTRVVPDDSYLPVPADSSTLFHPGHAPPPYSEATEAGIAPLHHTWTTSFMDGIAAETWNKPDNSQGTAVASVKE